MLCTEFATAVSDVSKKKKDKQNIATKLNTGVTVGKILLNEIKENIKAR